MTTTTETRWFNDYAALTEPLTDLALRDAENKLGLAEMLEEQAARPQVNLPQVEATRVAVLRDRAERLRLEAWATAGAVYRYLARELG